MTVQDGILLTVGIACAIVIVEELLKARAWRRAFHVAQRDEIARQRRRRAQRKDAP